MSAFEAKQTSAAQAVMPGPIARLRHPCEWAVNLM
jgi:hypothetical protein